MSGEHPESDMSSVFTEITFDENLSVEDAAEDISESLKESNKDLIYDIVGAIGVRQSIALYEETIRIETSGGMKREGSVITTKNLNSFVTMSARKALPIASKLFIQDGSGKKTPGGVFFHLISHDKDIFNEDLKKIFSDHAHKKEKLRKLKIKEERRRKSDLLKAKFIEEGLLRFPESNNGKTELT